MKKNKILCLQETNGIKRIDEFIQIGIPLPASQFFERTEIQLVNGSGNLVPSERSVLAYWPDNSIKWCLLKFYTTLNAHEKQDIFLTKTHGTPKSTNTNVRNLEQPESIIIETQNCNFIFNKFILTLFEKVYKHDKLMLENSFFRLVQNDNDELSPKIKKYYLTTAFSEIDQLYTELRISGEFQDISKQQVINLEIKSLFHFPTDIVHCTVTLHNPQRAIHPSGIWDLGDINSLFINDFSMGFDVKDLTDIQCKAEEKQDWLTINQSDLILYQESSGGKNWDSPNHKNRENRVPLRQNGYTCQHNNKTITGKRASPTLKIGSKAGLVKIYVKKFWQNFPKSIGINGNRAEIGLFPKQFADKIELQPGEMKTHEFYLNFGDQSNEELGITNPVNKLITPDWINECKVSPLGFTDTTDDPVEQIIQQGLSSEKYNFFAKREMVDEYGWRNFGDLYADHETSLYKGDEIFVSHYNNQYDPIYGFLNQFLLTGNNDWLVLSDDLARHVTDIDIYHTNLDRDEYNGGNFWHTDHYLDAATSSHRSFSKYHDYVYEGHAGGGGPGGQHCYTTGLLYHYLITGCESSRQAVFELCDWITYVYEGSGNIFSFLIAIKNSSHIDAKNIMTKKYPLDRGTGYYINALLDKFFLTRETALLDRVEHIIRNTVHPLDDIEQRELGDAERRWYYTVFFQSLCRYLQVKEEMSELDNSFYYARDSLLHYADWMVEHEYPYLEKPEILEFPNHTWTAQDIRKVNILFFAAYYSNQYREKYLVKAQKLYQYIADNLSQEPTRTYTRILSILMQNYIPRTILNESRYTINFDPVRDYEPIEPPSIFSVTKNLLSEFIRVMRHFTIKKEIIWLKKRSQTFRNIFGGI